MFDDQSEPISMIVHDPVPEGTNGILTELSDTDLSRRASNVGQLQGRFLLCERVKTFLTKSCQPRSVGEQLLLGESGS